MKFCHNCGAMIDDDAVFCPDCGTKNDVKPENVGQNYQTQVPKEEIRKEDTYKAEEFVRREAPKPEKEAKKSSNALTFVLIGIASVLVIALIIVCIFLFTNQQTSSPQTPVPTPTFEIEEPEEKETVMDVGERIDKYIDKIANKNDIAFALCDNETGEVYEGDNADEVFTAWGLYMPIYLAYTDLSNYDYSIASGILSNDPATCNQSANTAIERCGGLDAVNRHLNANFSSKRTSYGRRFGDVNSLSDNYTTASDAMIFLKEMYDLGASKNMDYNVTKFGIDGPKLAFINAHVGTENSIILKEVNLFAVIEGDESEYSVVILTKNKASVHISDILDEIHSEMEKLYEE